MHEFSHGYVAYRLGDITAKRSGRLSLNPLHHIDPIGFLCLILFRFGWAKPVPVSFGYLKNPRRDMALIAAAGPVSNVLLSFLTLLLITLSSILLPASDAVYKFNLFLSITAQISAGLAVFNLIPIAPLDGSHIFMPLLPKKAQAFFISNGNTIQIVMIILLFLGFLSRPIGVLTSLIIKGLIGVIEFLFWAFGSLSRLVQSIGL